MKIEHLALKKMAIYLILLSIPFSYFTILNVRVLPILVVMAVILLVPKSLKIKVDLSAFLFILMILFVFFMSLLSGDFNSFFSLIIFFIIAYWPILLKEIYFNQELFDKLVGGYILIACLMSFGVILQSILYNKFGIVIGKVDEMYERIGFGFIWSDYSFFSLYLASAIPLIWYKNRTIPSIMLSLFILLGSLVTTARTGFFGLLIFLICLMFLMFLKTLAYGKIDLRKFIGGFVVFGLLVFVFFKFFLENFGRLLDLDSSGRLEGYYDGFNYFLNNMLLGSYYSIDIYKSNVGVIPHNLFLFNLAVGGGVFFVLFVFWLYLLIRKTNYGNKFVGYSLFVIVVGFQFIPAVFTAYFFAFLISLLLYSNRMNIYGKGA